MCMSALRSQPLSTLCFGSYLVLCATLLFNQQHSLAPVVILHDCSLILRKPPHCPVVIRIFEKCRPESSTKALYSDRQTNPGCGALCVIDAPETLQSPVSAGCVCRRFLVEKGPTHGLPRI